MKHRAAQNTTACSARHWFFDGIVALERPVHILVPNQRLALFLSRDWAFSQRQQHQVWRPLSIQPFRDWLLSLWQSYAHQQGVIGQSIQRLITGDEALRLWDDITQGQHAEDALEADRLCREWSLSYTMQECNDHQRQHVRWQAQFQKFKQLHQLFDDTDLLLWLCASLDDTRLESTHFENTHVAHVIDECPASIVCYGFIEFSPLQSQFLDVLEAHGIEVIRSFDSICNTFQSRCERPQFEQWLDPQAELQGAAQWAKETWLKSASLQKYDETNLFDGPRVAVIVPDLAQCQDQVKSMMSDVLQWQTDLETTGLPWTISAGKSLSDYPLMATFLDIVDVCFHDISIQNLEALLRSPHWGANRLAPYVARILEPLRATGRRRWRLADVYSFLVQSLNHFDQRHAIDVEESQERQQEQHQRDELFHWLDHLLAESQAVTYHKMSWKDWLQHIMQCINNALWPGPTVLSSVDFQLMQRWHKWWVLQSQEISLVASAEQLMTFSQVSVRLKRLWRELMFQPEASTDRILVLGLLEAAALPLDAVYILRLSAENWPAASQPNPFLPYEAQRAASLPRSTPLREVWYAEALLRVYAHSSQHIVLSYSSSRDDVPQFPSPIVRTVFGEYHSILKVSPIWQNRLIPVWTHSQDTLAPLEGATHIAGGAYGLAQQGLCPFLGALALRVKVKPVAYTQRTITAADRGRWMHKVLELVWQQLQTQRHQLAVEEIVHKSIARVLEQAIRNLPSLMTPVTLEVEKKRLRALVLSSLELEKDRESFTVQGIEVKYPLQVADFCLDLRLDRWDLQQDQWVLIDYKSSRPLSVEDRQLAPQLLLYSLSLAQQKGVAVEDIPLFLGEAVYLVLKPSTGVQWINVIEPHESVASWFTHEYGLLLQLLEEVRHGKSSLEPYQGDKTCKACVYQSYCRVKQRTIQRM